MNQVNNTDDNNVEDPGLQAVNNFEYLMQLFPNEHPANIHGIILMGNHEMETVTYLLRYVNQSRKQKEEIKSKKCLNCTNTTESDMDNLEDSLMNIDAMIDDSLNGEGVQIKTDNSATKNIIKLEAFADAPKKKIKGKNYVIPSTSVLKNVYKDKNSQFVKIVDAS